MSSTTAAPMELTPDNYHSLESDRVFMSSTQFSKWLECGAAEYFRQNNPDAHPDDKEWALAGRYCHVAKLEPDQLPQFEHDNPELVTRKFPTHNELKELAAANDVDLTGAKSDKRKTEERIREAGVDIPPPVVALRHEYGWIPATLAAFDRQSIFSRILSVGKKERIIAFELGGIWWKARIDNDRTTEDGAFDDLKFMADFADKWSDHYGARVPWYSVYRYERQAAIYQRAIFSDTGAWSTPNLLAASKQKTPDVDWIVFDDQRLLEEQIREVEKALPLILMWKAGTAPADRCESCDYCRGTKVLEGPTSALNCSEVV